MAGQKNDGGRPRPSARNRHARRESPPGADGTFSRPGLAIPRRVAPQQSPTPFHQAAERTMQIGGRTAAEIQNRPNAPTGSAAGTTRPAPENRKPNAGITLAFRPKVSEEKRPTPPEPNTRPSLVHLLVLTRPFVAGFEAPNDRNWYLPAGGNHRIPLLHVQRRRSKVRVASTPLVCAIRRHGYDTLLHKLDSEHSHILAALER